MAHDNQWACFGLEGEKPKPRRRLFKHVDTSRMSWHDCHIGYTFVALPLLVAFPWVLAGMIAMLNGGYAVAFTARSPGCYSRPLWWFALFASLVIFSLFTAGEIFWAKQAGFGTVDLLVLVLITKLALGQLAFLFRIRREQPIPAKRP